MPKLTVQSNITQPQTHGQPLQPQSGALKVAVLANFSGRNTSANENQPLTRRKNHRITKDTFEDVFENLEVTLELPLCDNPIVFAELDNLNPDHLYQNISLFGKYKHLIQQVNSPALFHLATEALQAEGLIEQAKQEAQKRGVLPENLLDSVLGNAAQQSTSAFSADALIRQTIAPYIEAQIDPRAEQYTQAIENAVSDLMRSLLHASQFKQLEASWRSLDFINRRLDTDRTCQLSILDIALPELIQQAQSFVHNIENSALYKNLIESHLVAGGTPYDVIVVDHTFTDTADDALLLHYLTNLSAASGVRVLTAADITITGYQSIDDVLAAHAPQKISAGLAQVQQSQGSQNVFLALPHFMVRLPFGKQTQPIDSFNFEEIPSNSTKHPYYLWGNSAYLLLTSLVQDHSKITNSATIERLPMHVTQDTRGEDLIIPATGYYLPLPAVQRLENAGVTIVQSIKNSDAAFIERWVAFHA